jgi:putative methionine-R-sulfoxide reductase with GAF domain
MATPHIPSSPVSPCSPALPSHEDIIALRDLQSLLGGPEQRRDLLALALWPHEDPELRTALAEEGVSLVFAPSQSLLIVAQEALRPELLLIDPAMVDEGRAMPRLDLPIIALSSEARGVPGEPLPAWMRSPLGEALRQAKAAQAELRQRAILDALGWNLQRIAAMSQIIAAAPSPREAVQQLMMLVRDLFAVEAGTLYRYDEHYDRLVFEVVFGSQQALLDQLVMPAGRGIAGSVMHSGDAALVNDTAGDPRFAWEYDRMTGFESRSMLCVPLEAAGCRWGVLQLINKTEGPFTAEDLLTLRMISFLAPVVAALEAYEAEQVVG